jgi:hypothetical protein
MPSTHSRSPHIVTCLGHGQGYLIDTDHGIVETLEYWEIAELMS